MAGRPSNAVRAVCSLGFQERIPVLCEIADDKDAKASDRIAAIKVLGQMAGLEHEEKATNNVILVQNWL